MIVAISSPSDAGPTGGRHVEHDHHHRTAPCSSLMSDNVEEGDRRRRRQLGSDVPCQCPVAATGCGEFTMKRVRSQTDSPQCRMCETRNGAADGTVEQAAIEAAIAVSKCVPSLGNDVPSLSELEADFQASNAAAVVGKRTIPAHAPPQRAPTASTRRLHEVCSPLLRPNANEVEGSAWEKLEVDGVVPSEGCSGHELVRVGREVWLFGGCEGSSQQSVCLERFMCYDIDRRRWRVVRQNGGESPPGRASFGMCRGPDTRPDTLVVAGGTGNAGLCRDVWEWHTRLRQWRRLEGPDNGLPAGEACNAYGHSVAAHRGGLLFFGGSTGYGYTARAWAFDPERRRWARLATTGPAPSPRYRHQAAVVGDRLFVLGGGNYKPCAPDLDVYVLDLRTLAWSYVTWCLCCI
eukprot:CAMPEP_0206384170 /NCGR_PEP_ID=MMETSP0294-20121207/14406_1 /ASSEMBLY_ACC=CAM_ASM_000327 /TAXON_ID=39354 /ORGANISM="Heterosigma akashiwo, Strain CCMP2393" /LENGTH=405 /DNA_ID=CAMNT_0053834411 /DNA_START=69 /DNA_END=1286 /DNA_ORIENTATION=-